MELTIDKRNAEILEQNDLSLTDWEMIFWQNNKDKNFGNNKDVVEKIRLEIKRQLAEYHIYSDDYNKFKIRVEGNEDLERYTINHPGKMVAQWAEEFGQIQFRQYNELLNLLDNSNYDDAFKCLIFKEVLTNVYRIKNQNNVDMISVDKRILGETLQELMFLPKQVLDYLYNKSNKYKSFKTAYEAANQDYKSIISAQNSEFVKDIKTFGKGEWIRIPSKENDPVNFYQNVNKLKMLSRKSWCTYDNPEIHLMNGDMYIFVNNESKSEIAVKLIGDDLDEVRGADSGFAQEIGQEFRDVAIEFLKENQKWKNADKWLDKEQRNSRLFQYLKHYYNDSFEKIDLDNFYFDILKDDELVHGIENSLLRELRSKFEFNEKIREVFLNSFNKNFGTNFKMKDVHFGNITSKSDFSKSIAVVFGDVNITNTKDSTTIVEKKEQKPLTLFGKVVSRYKKADSLSDNIARLKYIIGNANFCNSDIKNLDMLCYVYKMLNLQGSEVENLDSLECVGESINLTSSKVKILPKLKSVKRLIIDSGQKFDITNVDLAEVNINGRNMSKENYIKYEVTDLFNS